MLVTGLSWQQTVALLALFFHRFLGGERVSAKFAPSMENCFIWLEDAPGVEVTYTPKNIASHRAIRNVDGKVQEWHLAPEGNLQEIIISDFPEMAEDCTRIFATRQADGTWSATLEAGPDANPIYREAFECLANQPATAA